MVDAFFRRAYSEYKRQIDSKESFERQIEKIKSIVASRASQTNDSETAGQIGSRGRSQLLLFPLVEIAWAEGRGARRELVLATAKRTGVEPGSAGYRRLSEWLDLHPTDGFYSQSLDRLREEFEKLPEEDKTLRRLDLLSDCVNVAEASGGTSRYPAGGARICDEERAAVKRIAMTLNKGNGAALAA